MHKRVEGRLWIVACAALVTAAAMNLAGCGVLRSGPQREVRAEPYRVVYATEAPKIDGKLDDAVWKEAILIKPFYQYSKTGVKVDFVKTWMAWDKKYLYFATTVTDKDIYVTEVKRDAILCRADVAELFLKLPVKTRYETELYEFEFNVWETIWDIHYIGYGGGGHKRFSDHYNPNIICRATHKGTINNWNDEDEGYTIEVAIPLSAFEHAAPDGVKAGDKWRFNASGYDFSVYRRKPLLWSSADGNMKGFNEYELYPEMVFLGPNEE